MAINFPSNPNNGDTLDVGQTTYAFNSTTGVWDIEAPASSGASTTVYADMAALIAATGMSNGDQAFVTANNNLYIYSGSGWYKVATVQNDSPSAITGVNGTYELAIDGTSTVITAVSTDPEGFPLTWSYSTSGLGSIATVSNVDNVFTITPSTTEADAGTFSLTINATDGINGAVSTSTNLTLNFIVTVTNSKYTTLLATATDTSDNDNIIDSSANNHTPTLINPADALSQGSFSPYRSGGYSTHFDGSGDFLEGPAVDLLGSGAFTLECWAYISSTVSTYTDAFLAQYQSNQKFIFGVKSDVLRVWMSGSEVLIGTTNIVGDWHHFALVRDSNNNCQVYIDGNAEGSSFSNSTDFSSSLENFEIGSWDNGANSSLDGYITDLRIVKGTAITPPSGGPTERLEAVTNTSLLACHLPYISDGSTNNHSITPSGDVSTKPFSPYDYDEYSVADNGGSIESANSDDTSSGRTGLSFADHADFDLAGSDWTFEWWAYVPKSEGVNNLNFIKKGPQGSVRPYAINYRLESGQPGWEPRMFGSSDGSSQWQGYSGSAWQPWSTWTHIAFVRNGSTITRYINGKAYGTGSGDVFDNNEVLYVGGGFGDEQPHTYSDLRISKSAVYTSEFTPPTAPLSSSGSVLHLKGANASIIDKSQGSNLKLYGNTTGSTTQVKFANTKSMYFDGTGDYIGLNDQLGSAYGTGDFTVEGWVYLSSAPSNYYYIWAQGSSTSGTNNFGVYYQSNVLKVWHNGSTAITGTNALSLNTWHYVALSREGTSLKLFLDGTQEGSTATNSSNITSSATGLTIARWAEIGDNGVWTGYISDFRVTKGLARYTANFTPPTEPLKG